MHLKFILFFLSLNCFCQQQLTKDIDDFVGVDIYENYYYFKKNTLYKSNVENNYINLKYGKPDYVDISNPLQVFVFYKPFNKVILLDNYLNWVDEYDTPIGTQFMINAGNDTWWLYNQIQMQLNSYKFKNKKIISSSIPLTQQVIKLKGDLNNAYVLTKDRELIAYNYLAQKTKSTNINRFLSISMNPDYSIQNQTLYKNGESILTIPTDVVSFEIQNNNLYYFDGERLWMMEIPKN